MDYTRSMGRAFAMVYSPCALNGHYRTAWLASQAHRSTGNVAPLQALTPAMSATPPTAKVRRLTRTPFKCLSSCGSAAAVLQNLGPGT